MKIGYKIININLIEENTRNPNSMQKHKYTALVENIKRSNGNYKQPILVREKGEGRYEIIDGAHRYRACKEL
jgi:ParB/RepB/Spo0J family partition protein